MKWGLDMNIKQYDIQKWRMPDGPKQFLDSLRGVCVDTYLRGRRCKEMCLMKDKKYWENV